MDESELHRKTRKAIETPNHAHEFTFSTYHKRRVLDRPGIPELVLEALDKARHKFDFEINAYVVMPDHVHALIRPRNEEYSIGPILQAIKGASSKRAFEQEPMLRKVMALKPPKSGAEYRLWQSGGGYDRNIIHARPAWSSIRYIHLNPVRKSLCELQTDWPWSSARAYEGGETPIPVDLCTWWVE